MHLSKFQKRLLLIFLGFVVLVVALLAIAPTIAKNQLEKHGKEWVGRKLQVENLSVNYFTSTLKVSGATMFEANDKDTFVSLDSLILDLDPLEYFSSSFVVEQLYVKNLWIKITQKDSIFNFDDLIGFYDTDEPGDTIVESEDAPYLFSLSDIKLNGGTLVYEDQAQQVVQTLDKLSFYLPHVEWGRGSSNIDASFKLAEGGNFVIDSEFDSHKGNYALHVEMDSVDIAPFTPYTKDYMQIGGMRGLASGNVDIQGNLNDLDSLNVQGLAVLEHFALLDSLGQTFLGAEKVSCPLKNIVPMKSHYSFGDIVVYAPEAAFDLYKDSNNFFRSFGLDEPESISDVDNQVAMDSTAIFVEEPVDSSLFYAIDSLHVEQGKLQYTDHTTTMPFKYDFSDLKMDFGELKSDSDWVSGNSSMVLNDRGQLEAEIGFNPNDPMNIKVDYVISDFQLSDLHIYSMDYTGYPILYGEMYYKGLMEIDEGNLHLENKLVVHNAELGDKKGGAFYNLPLKIALFILKDKDGVIDMDIPVRGNLNDPEINIRKIVWKTFSKFIVKTVTSPFRALSNLISVDPSDIKEINYTYMDTTLVASKKRQLNLLRSLEKKKPGLDIELVYFNDTFRQKEEIEKTLELADEPTIDSLTKAYDSIRIASVRKFLSTEFGDSTKIKVTVPDKFSPKNRGSQPIFEIKYKMQGQEEQVPEITENEP